MEAKFDKQSKATTYEDGVPVDVTGLTRSGVPPWNPILMKEDPDETEYSSSFADSTSGNDNFSGPSDAEAESQLCNESGFGSSFDGFGSLFPLRKKKLTSHWRNFISPLMWRCKWVEVKLKEFKSQVTKYDREMAVYDREKHQVLDQMLLQDSGSKSIPYIHQSEKKKAMKRRKRQRTEGTDISSYMSNHKLFSYFENKKSDPDGNSAGDELCNVVLMEQNTGTHDELVSDDFSILKHSDDLPEQILRKIELLHTRVNKLNAQLDTVMAKNALKFSSSENLSNLGFYEAQDSSVRNPTFSACNGETVSAGCLYTSTQHIAVNDFGDSIMHDGAISSFGVANPPPDISESSTGFLSFVDAGTQHQGQVGDSGEKIVDNILVQNEASEVEGCLLKMNHDQSSEKNLGTEKNIADESTIPPAVPVPQPNAMLKAGTSQEQSTLRPCLTSEIHFPSTASKRKRGERKAGGGGWNWQKPGEPDSQ